MPPALARLFRHRQALVGTIALGLLLGLSTLRIAFFTDDYTFLAFLETAGPKQPSTFNLYDFAHGRADTQVLMARGPFPWWTDPDLKLRFVRPISSALFLLDHAIFGHAPLGYHIHALFWYALFLTGVAFLFSLLFDPPLRIWCALLFALNAAHAEPLAWLASRHLLVASTPAIWGLVAHISYREHGFRDGRWISVLGLAIGLLGGEAALGIVLFWIAYELGGSSETNTRAKLARAAAPVAIVLVYLAAYKVGDFGSAHNAAYFEPLSDPKGFLAASMQRLPIMLGEMLLTIPSALGTVFVPAPFVAIGLLATALITGMLFSVWSIVPESERRAVRWLTVGALASLSISVGGFPGSRLLLTPSIGGCAIIGTILCYGWQKLALPTALVVARRSAWVLLFAAHVVLAPLMYLGISTMYAKLGALTAEIDVSLDGVLPRSREAATKSPSVFSIASDPLASIYVAAAHALRSPGTISGWSVLSMTRATHDIRRTDDRTLVIVTDHPMLHGSFEGVFRNAAEAPMRVGHRVELEETTVTVLAEEDGYPTSIEVRFVAPLEDDRFRLLAWQDGKLLPLRVAIHDHIVIPWTPGPTGFF